LLRIEKTEESVDRNVIAGAVSDGHEVRSLGDFVGALEHVEHPLKGTVSLVDEVHASMETTPEYVIDADFLQPSEALTKTFSRLAIALTSGTLAPALDCSAAACAGVTLYNLGHAGFKVRLWFMHPVAMLEPGSVVHNDRLASLNPPGIALTWLYKPFTERRPKHQSSRIDAQLFTRYVTSILESSGEFSPSPRTSPRPWDSHKIVKRQRRSPALANSLFRVPSPNPTTVRIRVTHSDAPLFSPKPVRAAPVLDGPDARASSPRCSVYLQPVLQHLTTFHTIHK
jgi:hypothetical protein